MAKRKRKQVEQKQGAETRTLSLTPNRTGMVIVPAVGAIGAITSILVIAFGALSGFLVGAVGLGFSGWLLWDGIWRLTGNVLITSTSDRIYVDRRFAGRLVKRTAIERSAMSCVEVLQRPATTEEDEVDSRSYIFVTLRDGETTTIGRELNLSDRSAHQLHAVITRSPSR